MDSTLDAYLLSNSSITISSGKLAAMLGSGMAKSASSVKHQSTPHKSGEIFRTENGKFSFSCTLCGAVCKTCPDILHHIDSHFEELTSNTLEEVGWPKSPSLAQPEFVSTGELIPEADGIDTTVTRNGISYRSPNMKFQPKLIYSKRSADTARSVESNPTARVVRIIRRRRRKLGEIKDTVGENPAPATKIVKLEPSEVEHTADEGSNSPPTTRIVRIIKRKRKGRIRHVADVESATIIGKQKSNDIEHSMGDESDSVQMAKVVPQKLNEIKLLADEDSIPAPTDKVVNVVTLKRIRVRPGIEDSTKIKGNVPPTESRPAADDTKSNGSVPPKTLNLIETDRPVYVRSRNRSCCYQCEMEPRIYEPSDSRRHICLFCPIWFPNHVEFENHVQTIHDKDPNYVQCKEFYCYVCGKSFHFRSYLSGHLKLHKETADFLCATCGNGFKAKSRLTEHMKMHQDRTFECDLCGKVFKQFARLRTHLWCHSTKLSFVCRICSKAFKMRRYLNIHMAVHKEGKIKCRHCDATFHFNSVRRAHEKNRHDVI